MTASPLMPAEWTAHERTWMAFPPPNDTFGERGGHDLERARTAWLNVARTIAKYEPVTLIVDPGDEHEARAQVGGEIDIVLHQLDDAWLRDAGPSFAFAGDELVAVDWVFNGWGAQGWAAYEHDAKLGRFIAEQAGVRVVDSPLVNEGGGIHVDGLGTVLLTKTVQLDPGRNPNLTAADVEREFARTIGTTKSIWFERGLTRDYDEFGTRGHVDIIASFAGEGRVLVHDQRDRAHPDHLVSEQLQATLRDAVDARGERLEVIPVPAPKTLRDHHGWVDWSYINHYVCNGAVILCAFDDEHDAVAAEILQRCYPDHVIELVDARDIFAFGGGIHCITQQQPRRG
ncbi:agmatine/peptidylarginine deiminase [Gulosibacter hominis]|uniref:agmatine deiminase family protein n=1 Tax=Gulosibacter hominis TaxID=2770504 RepID=UPI001E4270F7|nr:agmatine deiminase family protein [Gulosibacter hominis]